MTLEESAAYHIDMPAFATAPRTPAAGRRVSTAIGSPQLRPFGSPR